MTQDNNPVSASDYSYVMPHNQEEISRLRNQHKWVKSSMNDKLVFTPHHPFQSALKILDSATADGFWCLDAAQELPPNTEFVAFDIADHLFPPPDRIPPGIDLSFAKLSLTDPFPDAWHNAFDLVHQRFIWASLVDHTTALRNLLGAVKPGGWIQLVDVDMQARPETQFTPPAFGMLRKLAAALLVDSSAARLMKGWVEDHGFEEVTELVYDISAGMGHPDRDVGAVGKKNLLDVLEMYMTSYSTTKLDIMGLSKEEWNSLPQKMAEEMDTWPLTVRINVVCGRKPVSK